MRIELMVRTGRLMQMSNMRHARSSLVGGEEGPAMEMEGPDGDVDSPRGMPVVRLDTIPPHSSLCRRDRVIADLRTATAGLVWACGPAHLANMSW